MPRSIAPLNGVRLLSAPSPSDAGGMINQTVTYSVGWYAPPPSPGAAPIFHDAPAVFRLGSGTLTISLPDTTSPLYSAIIGALLAAIKAAEGMNTGDAVILADGITTVQFP